MDKTLGDKIPEFNKKPGAGGNVGLSGASFSLGDHRTKFETFIIILVAVIIVANAAWYHGIGPKARERRRADG